MIEQMFFLFAGLGVLFLIISVKWESLTFGALAWVMWLGCSIGAFQYEIPYQYVISSTVYEATQTFEMHVLAWVFVLMMLITTIHVSILGYDLLKQRKPKMM